MARRYFTTDTLDFLQDLELRNEREWFLANKDRYETSVREPMLQLVADAEQPFHERISPHVACDARKVGGSMFRINRDVRFSKDKTPYKTHAGAFFRHDVGKEVAAPGLYLHLEPGNCFLGVGLYHPPSDALRAIRTCIVDQRGAWHDARDAPGLRRWTRGALDEQLTRAPKGFDADDPDIEDLRCTSFVISRPITEKQATGTRFLDLITDRFAEANPYAAFLCRSQGLDW